MCTCSGSCSGSCGTGSPTNGLDGQNAFTLTTANFTVPNVSSNVTINVSEAGQATALWGGVGQPIWIEGAGAYLVVSVATGTMVITNSGGASNALPAAPITLGAKVSPSGLSGAGTNGSAGLNGTTVLEIDTTDYVTAQLTAAAVQKTFSIPANTWQTVDDMVELEIFTVGQRIESGFHTVYVELDGAALDVGLISLTGQIFGSAGFEPQISIKIQMVLTASGEITPVSVLSVKEGSYANNIGFSWTFAKDYTIKGVARTGLTTSSSIVLDVSLTSPNASVSHKMFYYKLTSYKK